MAILCQFTGLKHQCCQQEGRRTNRMQYLYRSCRQENGNTVRMRKRNQNITDKISYLAWAKYFKIQFDSV